VHLQDGVAVGWRLDAGGAVDFLEGGELRDGLRELDRRRGGYGGSDLGDRLRGVRWRGRFARLPFDGNKVLVPLLGHRTAIVAWRCGEPKEPKRPKRLF